MRGKLTTWVALVLCCLLIGALGLYTVRSKTEPTVAAGVILLINDEEVPLERLNKEQITAILQARAEQCRVQPVEPALDPINRGLVPGLAGRVLNVEGTVDLLLAAAPGAAVPAQLDWVLPETSLWEMAEHPIYHGNPLRQEIALVINVAWGNEYLPEMLDILRREQVKASFFLVGRWVDRFPEFVEMIGDEGHELANHAYSDPHLPRLTESAIAQEITRTSEAITRITGEPIRFFSPPYNDFDDKVLKVASNMGYLTVLCSLDTADWMRPGVDRIVRRIVPKAHNGAIVLMHPTEQTPAALAEIITGLKAKGYKLVTVGELLSPIPGTDLPNP